MMNRQPNLNAAGSLRRAWWIVALVAASSVVPAGAAWWTRSAKQTRAVRPVSHVEMVPTPEPDVAAMPVETVVEPTVDAVGFGGSSPAAPHPIHGVDCVDGCCGERGWGASRPLDFQPFAQGEYVGHARL